jgi:hypothetical protein
MSNSPTAQTTAPHVYQAINQVMARLAKEGITKDRQNTQQGYKFRGIDDVYNALAPILSESSLCILPSVQHREVTERQTKSGSPLFYVNVDVDFHFVSSKDGSQHIVSMSGEAMDSADKATNKAMSAAFKYACIQTFCIPTEGEDNDADSHTPAPAVRQVEPVAKAQAQRKPTEKLVGTAEVNTITQLADIANIPLDIICDKYTIKTISELKLSNAEEVIARLQTLAQKTQEKESV